MEAKIVTLPGDGISPEVVAEAVFYKGDKWEKDAPTLLLSKASGELTFYLMPGEYKIDLSGFETKRRKIDWLIRIEIEK